METYNPVIFQKNRLRRASFYNYVVLTLLIATTGFPFFYNAQEFIFIGFAIAAVVFFNRGLTIEKHLLQIVLLFVVVEVLQGVMFDKIEPVTISGTLVRILFGYFVARILATHFIDYFFRIIYVLAVISLLFYIPSILSSAFFNFFAHDVSSIFQSPFAAENEFYSVKPNILIYCFHEALGESARNSGPFWEPGAFALFLDIAILLRLIQRKQLFEPKLILLYIVVITTFSTAGVTTLLILLISFYMIGKTHLRLRYFFAAIFVIAGYYVFMNVEFLGAKTNDNIRLAQSTTSSRFGSALADLRDFSESPFIGWGRGTNRYGGKQFTFFSVSQHRNNGVTYLLATYGIIIFVVYFGIYYRNLRNICYYFNMTTAFALFALLIILLLGFSQAVFTRPFFYSLLFVGIPIANSYYKRNIPNPVMPVEQFSGNNL